MSKTDKNLMDAFAGESQANRKYLAYAQVAAKEGKDQVAKLFRAAAAAETIHAWAHFKNAGKLGDTAANLQDALAGELEEANNMYPYMVKDAQEEGKKAVQTYLGFAGKVEAVHAELYKKAIEGASSFKGDYYICPICGYTHEGPFEGKCPVCGADGSKFKTAEEALKEQMGL